MADVFISSSRLDQDRVGPIAERLASLGYNVWPKGANSAGPSPALEAAHAIVAIWSHNARHSLRVCAEAAYAAERGVLVQIKLEPMSPPPPFGALPAVEIFDERSEWGILEDALARLARGEAPPATPPPARAFALAGAPGLMLLALTAALAAPALAVGPATGGVLTLDQLQFVAIGALGVAGLCTIISAWRFATMLRA